MLAMIILGIVILFCFFMALCALVLWAFGIKGMLLLKMSAALGGTVVAASAGLSALSKKQQNSP